MLPDAVECTLKLLRDRALRATRRGDTRFRARLGLAEKPTAIRSFWNTPREAAELTAGVAWVRDHIRIDLKRTAVESPTDGKHFRADGSEIGLSLGNFTPVASTMERWRGPGRSGSLILSNNARPLPALILRLQPRHLPFGLSLLRSHHRPRRRQRCCYCNARAPARRRQ